MPYDNPTSTSEFCWNRLMTSNVPMSAEFYSDLFGWEIQDAFLGTMKVSIFKVGNRAIGGIMHIPPGLENTYQPHWLSFVAVENIHVSVHKARKLGATVSLAITSFGASGTIAVIVDPFGAHLGLWQAPDVDEAIW